MIDKIAKTVQSIEIFFGTLFISIFFITIIIQVFGRYLGITVSWTGEVAMYSFTWAVFLGAGAMTYEDKHFAFTSLRDRVTGKKREVLNIFLYLIVMSFTLAILYYGVIITMKFWNYRWIDIPSMRMGYTWLCVPILGATTTLYCINHIVAYAKKLRTEA
ncbi:MAG: C4-dicarboxylate ABC transporter permease [Firmicutes bacterium HGW-Firmicutes-3]|nr:MAG: C4-dicarboxylate ABC transporter permease [Firmicutes bacterium HGW-Firmicutes-3]